MIETSTIIAILILIGGVIKWLRDKREESRAVYIERLKAELAQKDHIINSLDTQLRDCQKVVFELSKKFLRENPGDEK